MALLAVPCCLKWETDAFHFAKVWMVTGAVSSICIATVFYLIAIQRRWLRYVVTLFLGTVYFIEWFIFAHLHCRLNDKTVYLVLQTNAKECGEFLSTYLTRSPTLVPIIAIIVIVALYLVATKYLGKPRILSPKEILLFITVNVISLAVLLTGLLTTRFINQISNPTIIQLITATYRISEYCVDIKRLESSIKNADGIFIDPSETHPHIILVIGESFNPNHSPFYGYSLNTMPLLQKISEEGHIVVFNDAVTPSSSTGIVMEYLFTVSPPNNKRSRWDYPIFPMLFKKAGYKVNLMDNQQTRASGDLKFDAINCQFFNSEIVSKASLSYRNDALSSYDLDFVETELNHRHKVSTTPMIDIFHINGEHIPAQKRYPTNWLAPNLDYTYRSDITDTQKETVRQYDTAITYNDAVLARIITSIQNTDAILIFISDHGEEVHDFRNQYGRTMGTLSPYVAKNIYHVPMIIYTTPEYRANHHNLYRQIEQASKSPFYTADISQMLLHIAGITSKYVDKHRDPLSHEYQSIGRRIINEDTDYDQLISR